MMVELERVLVFLVLAFAARADETICVINGKKALHRVSDKFLGISIDPAVLLTGLNLSDTSLQLAHHLSPAYIRIAGPSTQFVKYEDTEDKSSEHLSEDSTNVVVTPAMWFGINEWLSLANLTPVFGINDRETTKGVWNPKSILPLLEISDKFNVTCYWQLGYDCSNKTESQYKDDLMIFRHVLDAFPERRDVWKIVGSDLNQCLNNEPTEDARKVLEDLQNVVTAVMWEPSDFLRPSKLLGPVKAPVSVWTTAPKNPHPVSFASAISWAKEMGEAARLGYDVIFRQPRLHEMFSDTPVYWLSILFKTLMGRNVLEAKSNLNGQVSIYAHCTKKQNSFVRSGAMTVFLINDGDTNHTTLLKFGSPTVKNTEVQSYILTAPSEDSADIYLNDNKLGPENVEGERLIFIPKLRRAKIMNFLTLHMPPKSIGFFVLPVARIPVCINEEDEMKLLMEEIRDDQNIPFSEEVSIELVSRSNMKKSPPSLKELQELMEKELESDEKYYSKLNKKLAFKKPTKKRVEEKKDPIAQEARNFFIEMAKLTDKQKKPLIIDHLKDLRQLLEKKEREEGRHRHYDLELTSAEIRRVLADRAKDKAAKKNIIFTSAELEELMTKATEKFLKNNNTQIRMYKAKRSANMRDRKDINMKLLNLKTLGEKRLLLKEQIQSRLKKDGWLLKKDRNKRDINMELLKLKTDNFASPPVIISKHKKIKSKFENNEEKEATMRQPDQTSEELLRGEEESVEPEELSHLPHGEIFAELASNEFPTTTERNNKASILSNLKPKSKPSVFGNLFNKPLMPVPKLDIKLPTIKPVQNFDYSKSAKVDLSDAVQVLTGSDEFESNLEEDDMPYIHEFCGPYLIRNDTNNRKTSEVFEMGEIVPVEGNKDNRLPALTNRGFKLEELKDNNNSEEPDLDELEKLLKDQSFASRDESDLENDYGDLESRESAELRFKRSLRTINRTEVATGGDIGKFYFVVGRPFNASAIKIDENWKNNQIKMLKNRLAHKKKLDMMNRYTQMKNKRRTRSLFEIDNFLRKQYESISDGIRAWKPADILNLTKAPGIVRHSHTTKNINDSPVFKIHVQNSLGGRSRRFLHDDDDVVVSAENHIDSFMNNDIPRGVTPAPMDEDESRDYQLIFPNKDKIELKANGGNIDLKFVQNRKNGLGTTENSGAVWATIEPAGFNKSDKPDDDTTTVNSSSSTQPNKNEFIDNIFDKLLNNVTIFLQDIGQRLKSLLMK